MILDELHTLLANWPLQDHRGEAPELFIMQAGGAVKPAKVVNDGLNLIVVLEESPLTPAVPQFKDAPTGPVGPTGPTGNVSDYNPAPPMPADTIGYGDLSGIPT